MTPEKASWRPPGRVILIVVGKQSNEQTALLFDDAMGHCGCILQQRHMNYNISKNILDR